MTASTTINYDLSTQSAWEKSAYKGYEAPPSEGVGLETAEKGFALGAFLQANPPVSGNDNHNDSLLSGAWGDTDRHGTGAPALVFVPQTSLEKQIEAVQAHLERGQTRRAEALLEKIIARYDRKGELDTVFALLDQHGLDDLITPDYAEQEAQAAELARQNDEWEEEHRKRLEAQAAPSF